MKVVKVNDAAGGSGILGAWLRFPEEMGRMVKARRDMNGSRVHTEEEVASLRQVLFP